LVDPAEDVRYYWLAADGARLSGSGQELRNALRTGALRAATLVWRSGWAEWLPATRVAELAAAIAEASAPPSSFGTLGAKRSSPAPKRPSSGPPPPPSRARAPMPTLSEEQGVLPATATLRPPGAVPPPARGVPVPALDSSPRATMTPVPNFGPPGGRVDTPLPAALPAVVNRALLPEVPPPSLEAPLSSTLEVAPQISAEARRTPVAPLPAARAEALSTVQRARQDSVLKIGRIGLDSRTVVMALSALCGALLVALLGLTLARPSGKTPAPEVRPQASSVPAPSTPKPAPGCRLTLPAARIAESVERSVPPYVARLEPSADFALGIAETKSKGLGLRLDSNTLDVSPSFEEEGRDAVRGVVPLTRSGSLTFFVDRDDRTLRSAHTIDAVPPFTLGVSDAGFSRVVAGSTSLIWQLDPIRATASPFVAVGSRAP
jgi:hypothetical protein